MNQQMWLNEATQNNLSVLKSRGVAVIGPDSGFQACGEVGPGRLVEVSQIVAAILAPGDQKLLAGKRVLITAGPTQEAIDPVRYITNRSSGKMGYALAKAAAGAGAEVSLVSGPTNLTDPEGVKTIRVQSTLEMFEAVMARAQVQDVMIMSAAVADYTPKEVATEKIKKQGDDLVIHFQRTQDILATVGQQKRPDQFLVGFALETQDEEANARRKLEKKNLDAIVLNSLRTEGAGFGHDTNQVTIMTRDGAKQAFPLKTKDEVAKDILGIIVAGLSKGSKTS